MPEEIHTEGNKASFLEETQNQLDGKEGYLVELGTAEGTIKILATPGNEIGTVAEILQPGQPNKMVTVRLLGGTGIRKFVQGAAINKGAKLMAQAGGKVITATSGNRSLGIKLTQAAGTDGAHISAMSLVEKV